MHRGEPPPYLPTSQATSREEDMLREVGDGGFFASDFQLEEQLGQISIQQVGVAGKSALQTTSQTHICLAFLRGDDIPLLYSVK
jgi:hypothetical protein